MKAKYNNVTSYPIAEMSPFIVQVLDSSSSRETDNQESTAPIVIMNPSHS